MIKNIFILFTGIFLAIFVNGQADANLIIAVGSFGTPFTNGGTFENHTAGSMATFSGAMGSAVFTTSSVGPSGSINENSGTIGVNSGSGSGSAFDVGETWAFSFDTAGMLTAVDFGLFTDANSEEFTISSTSLGMLTFMDNGPSDRFLGADSSGSNFSSITIAANEVITISYSGTAGGTATIEGFSFTALTSAVPEPGSALMFGSAMIFMLCRKRR